MTITNSVAELNEITCKLENSLRASYSWYCNVWLVTNTHVHAFMLTLLSMKMEVAIAGIHGGGVCSFHLHQCPFRDSG